jgi:hypothetical protein
LCTGKTGRRPAASPRQRSNRREPGAAMALPGRRPRRARRRKRRMETRPGGGVDLERRETCDLGERGRCCEHVRWPEHARGAALAAGTRVAGPGRASRMIRGARRRDMAAVARGGNAVRPGCRAGSAILEPPCSSRRSLGGQRTRSYPLGMSI